MGFPEFKFEQRRFHLSERQLAKKLGISRTTLRGVKSGNWNPTISLLLKMANLFEKDIDVLIVPRSQCRSTYSIPSVSLETALDGNWKIHFFNFVDEFTSQPDPRLVLLPPVAKLDMKLFALLASIVAQLCQNGGFRIPGWASETYFLAEPWFPSGMESLKATALSESPLWFRRNNIFVLANFLERV